MDLQLTGRTIFVTGGSRGIGKQIVLTLLQEGANVATCSREESNLAALRAALQPEDAARLLTTVCDVRSGPAMQEAIDQTTARFGGLDGLVANAGHGSTGTVLETPLQDYLAQYEIKLAGVLRPVQAALPALRASGAGRIVIMNGVTAHTPDGGMAAVSAARAALQQVARMLAKELAPQDICVNTINLGAVETERQRVRHAQSGSPLPYGQWLLGETLRREIPLGRLGQPEEIAPMAALLLSPLAAYITGAEIDIAGGM